MVLLKYCSSTVQEVSFTLLVTPQKPLQFTLIAADKIWRFQNQRPFFCSKRKKRTEKIHPSPFHTYTPEDLKSVRCFRPDTSNTTDLLHICLFTAACSWAILTNTGDIMGGLGRSMDGAHHSYSCTFTPRDGSPSCLEPVSVGLTRGSWFTLGLQLEGSCCQISSSSRFRTTKLPVLYSGQQVEFLMKPVFQCMCERDETYLTIQS